MSSALNMVDGILSPNFGNLLLTAAQKAYTTPRETPRFQFLLLEPLPIMMTSKLGKSDVGILG